MVLKRRGCQEEVVLIGVMAGQLLMLFGCNREQSEMGMRLSKNLLTVSASPIEENIPSLSITIFRHQELLQPIGVGIDP